MRNRSVTSAARCRKSRQRGPARLFVLGAAVAASTAASSSVAPAYAAAPATKAAEPEPQDTQQIRFSIQPGPLDDVLAAFERAAQVTVVLTDKGIGMIQSPGVNGTFTIRQALQELLAGTTVAFSFTARNAVSLDLRAPGEFVSVTGEGPGMTSPKFTEPLRDIPQTITVIPASVMLWSDWSLIWSFVTTVIVCGMSRSGVSVLVALPTAST